MNIAFGNGRIHEVIYTQRIKNIIKVIVLKIRMRIANLRANEENYTYVFTNLDVKLATKD